jgi:hypothetical protein
MEAAPGTDASKKKRQEPIDVDNDHKASDDAHAEIVPLCKESLLDTEKSWKDMGLDDTLLEVI